MLITIKYVRSFILVGILLRLSLKRNNIFLVILFIVHGWRILIVDYLKLSNGTRREDFELSHLSFLTLKSFLNHYQFMIVALSCLDDFEELISIERVGILGRTRTRKNKEQRQLERSRSLRNVQEWNSQFFC